MLQGVVVCVSTLQHKLRCPSGEMSTHARSQHMGEHSVVCSGNVKHMSRRWCCWLWWCYKCVTRVVLWAMVVLQMCQAGGVAGSGSVSNVLPG
jgi:hypothetical protein